MKYLIILASMFLLVSCSEKPTEKSVITRSADGKLYVNEHFDMTVELPAGWYFQDPESTLKLNRIGAGLIAGDNENMKAIMAESLKTTLPLFAFFRHEPGAPVKTNPNVISMAENIEIMPGVKSGCDYLFHARALLANAAVRIEMSENCRTQVINGTTFGYLDASMNLNGVNVYQRYYACVKNKHALSFIQTHFDEESKATVDGILGSLRISCQ